MYIKKLIVVAIVLNYLVPSWQWKDSYMYDFVSSFFPMVQSQEIVWFLSQRLTGEHTERLDSFIKRLVDFTQVTQFVWTDRSEIRMTKLVSKRNAMAIVFTTAASDPIMYVHNRVMTGRHFGLSLVVYVPKVSNISHILDVCYTLYTGSFVNSLVYFQTVQGLNNMFGYEQYPEFMAENRTDISAYVSRQYKKVLSASQDVGGYKFHTPLRQDLPHVIKYHDKQGRQQLQGTTFRVLETFVDSLNGSLVEYVMPPDEHGGEAINMKAVLALVRSRRIDVAAHAYALFRSDDDLDKSYPIMVVKWCLMVPLQNSIATHLYPLQPFEWKVWIIVASVLVALWCLDFSWIFWFTGVQGIRHKFLSQLSDAWLDDFCYVLNVATAKTVRITSWMRFINYACIFFFGVFLSANYTSYLGSFLTVTLFRAQINSIEDIVQAQLPVMVVDYELEFLLSEGYEMPPNFGKLLRPVDTSTFSQHQLKFNTSYAYFVTDDTWHFLDKAQKHLKQPAFKFSDICFGSYHLAFPIQTDSAVWRDLEYFLFHTHSNGLIQKYEEEAFEYSLSAGHMQRLLETHAYTSAGLQHLSLLFIFMGTMSIVSGVCLVMEMLLHNYYGGQGPFN